jgi:acetyl esterase/lipase
LYDALFFFYYTIAVQQCVRMRIHLPPVVQPTTPLLELIMSILAYVLSGLPLLMSVLFFLQLRIPANLPPVLVLVKLAAGALSPYLAIMGGVGAGIGFIYQAFWAIPIGIAGAGVMIWYIWRSTRDHGGFEKAIGAGWSGQIHPQQRRHMVQKRWSWFLKMKAIPEPSWERDIAFWTIPDTQRDLLCDLWRPAGGDVSGMGLVYIHGGGWTTLDKDFGTKPFFRHLVGQGHTVMDVAYRLCPEVDIYGMVGDVKRAIAWMKANASDYGVSPEKIAIVGSSTGGHLALLAGNAPQHPELTPEDVTSADLSVCGIVSYYGPTDLVDGYVQWKVEERLASQPPLPIGEKPDSNIAFRYAGRLDMLLGGLPQEIPGTYQLASPITHVHPGSPPTLLMQGDKDVLVGLDATNAFYKKLVESGVPAINVVFPGTEHLFDLVLPQINPAAQSALYDVDRFLALLLSKDWDPSYASQQRQPHIVPHANTTVLFLRPDPFYSLP